VQINSYSNSVPSVNQHFKGYNICKVSDDLQEVITKNESFKRLSSSYDVYVTGLAKGVKWSDPFRMRTPKANEKGSIICAINSKGDGHNLSKFVSVVNGKLYAPMEQHVAKLITFLEEFETQNILRKFY